MATQADPGACALALARHLQLGQPQLLSDQLGNLLRQLLHQLTSRPVICRRRLSGSCALIDVWLVDLLLADRLADFGVLGDGFLAEPDALDRDGLLRHDRPLCPQGNLVLFLADRLARQCGIAVSVGNRLPF